MKIFYSWQSDLPNASNRGFVEKALENVAKTLGRDRSVDIEPVIDRDTAGVSGSPEIVGTIFSKIEAADIFVCDVSIINGADSTRPSPNPNILTELGFALRALGENRVIMILNTAFGDVDKLPFDLRTRRVLTYTMPALQEDRATQRKELESSLETAIRAIRPRLALLPEYIRVFGAESETVKKLAFEQPPYWEYLLTIELLKPEMKRVEKEYEEVRSNLKYRKATKASNKYYFNVVQEKMIDMENIIELFTSTTTKEIPASWGAPGVAGDALEIKRAADRFISMCDAIVEWEEEINSVHPPEIFETLKGILRGTTAQMMSEAQRFVSEISAAIQERKPGNYAVDLKVELPDAWADRASRELEGISNWISQHPYEWNSE